MRKIITLVVVLGMASFYLNGCGQSPETKAALTELYKKHPDIDATSDPYYNFSPFAGTVWKTKVKVAIVDSELYTGVQVKRLLAPERFDSTHPQYNPPRDLNEVSVLPSGTLIRVARLMKDNGVAGHLSVIVEIECGTNIQKDIYFDPKLLEQNCFIPTGWESVSTNWSMNPDLLEEVK